MKKRFLTGIIVITAVMLVCLSGCGVQEAIEKKAKDKLGEKGVKPIGQKMVEDIIDTYNGENEGGGLEWGEGSSPWNHLPDEEDDEEDED